ncbi:hypothetical protein VFPFJ_02395 [Purpureocillium lilacinum]|uniref:Uncharacterized protein n=1 Tax=Purpureocillium lilacinum TaxID=33203 RepID=A0A179GNX8_PURLI|nr:hypothetical protein VFPFJ_02395 [Purpureocillium lilacinum]OAQ79011.1 hypothetical protein VFPBJ_07132 [Purpureocillium lilacinum]OAQ93234.1 hypothetical protein VFPFJ_02395 [Purpureocillium lilacinum]
MFVSIGRRPHWVDGRSRRTGLRPGDEATFGSSRGAQRGAIAGAGRCKWTVAWLGARPASRRWGAD